MTKDDIIVGRKYTNGFHSYLGIGKRVPFTQNEYKYTNKNLLCLDEGSEGLIVNDPEECAPYFWSNFRLVDISRRRSVKVLFLDGNSIVTPINGTESEIRDYYIGKEFNFGITEDSKTVATSVIFLD